MRAKGMGANVMVTEVDPIRAIEAKMDGFEVSPMKTAVKSADFVVTATGCKDVVTREHLEVMKDRCMLSNAGHFDTEISKKDLEEYSAGRRMVREYVEEYTLNNGRKVYLLGDGRLINLVAGQGHPVEIMDLSFSVQALCAAYIVEKRDSLGNEVYDVPREMDEKIARLKLKFMNVEIDKLNKEQIDYLSNWEEGT
jgi:adenosylhomocysteinase